MKISVITINYNTSDFTIELAKSLEEKTSKELEYELIIVDNASNDDEKKKIKFLEDKENIKIIYNRLNTGFAAGNMLGVQHSEAEYYFFLNNDMLIQNDILSILYNYINKHPECALVTAQLLSEELKPSVSFHYFPTLTNKILGNSVARLFNKDMAPSNKGTYTEPMSIEVVSGSCMFFDASVFDKLGGLETLFFLYCEEEDICKRVLDAGYKVYFIPEAKIVHYEGQSSQNDDIMKKEFYLSYFILLDKHFGFFTAKLLKAMTIFKLFRRSFKKSYYFKIFLFTLRGAPIKESLRYKQSIQKLYK